VELQLEWYAHAKILRKGTFHFDNICRIQSVELHKYHKWLGARSFMESKIYPSKRTLSGIIIHRSSMRSSSRGMG